LGRGNTISQVGVQDGAPRGGGEEAERGIVARQQCPVEAHAYQAGRLPVEEPTQIRGVRRWSQRAGRSHIPSGLSVTLDHDRTSAIEIAAAEDASSHLNS
jgi:hypothetical protein